MAALLTQLKPNPSLKNEEGDKVEVKFGADIKWIDPNKHAFVQELLRNEFAGVKSDAKMHVTVDGQPADMQTPIEQDTRTIEFRKPLGEKG